MNDDSEIEAKSRSKMKMCALLVAMSVGASIVIANPEAMSECDFIDDTEDDRSVKSTKTRSLLRKVRHRARGLATKTIAVGKELSYRAANATADLSERIGDTISRHHRP